MKKCAWIFILIVCWPGLSKGQSYEVQQLLLDVQKLSGLKQMLGDLKKGYDIVCKGYSAIQNISEGNFTLHRDFLGGLLSVSPAVQDYKRVRDIISLQLTIVSEYKSAGKKFKGTGLFTPAEMDYMEKVYARLFEETVNNLQTLSMVLTSGALRMSDNERLKQIDTLYEDMVDKLGFLRRFNNQNAVLLLQRTKEINELGLVKKMFGFNK